MPVALTATGSKAPNAAGTLSSTDDLKDKRIAVQLGTVYDLYAAKTFPGAKVMQFNTFHCFRAANSQSS